jgi:hypothetical protein
MKYLSFLVCFVLFIGCKKEIEKKELTINVTPNNGGKTTMSSGSYEFGSNLNITAIPSAEYIFKEWSGAYSGANNPLNIIMDSDKILTCVFEKRKYPLSVSITGQGTIKEEVISTEINSTNYTSGSTIRLTPQPSEGYQFKRWLGDDTSSKSPLDIKITKPVNLTCVFEKAVLKDLKVENTIDTLIISKKHKYSIKGSLSTGTNINLSDSITISSTNNKVSILPDKTIVGAQSGTTIITLSYNNIVLTDTIYISDIEDVKLFDTYLSTPASGANITVPVVVINYYATLNGIDIDTKRQPNYGSPDPITIDNLKNKTIDQLKLTKFGLEEGSKFRGFNNPNAIPNIGIKVIKYYNIYEIKKVMSADKINYFADFIDMFNRLNIKDAVNNLGVKEIWFSLRPLSSEYPVVRTENLNPENFQAGGPESNMSSPTTGDVSNSWRIANDLPIYNSTYVVYTYNLHRSHAENIHNHGHQIEAQLDHLDAGVFAKDERLFLNNFVGISNINFSGKPFGRNGMTHFPPNTKVDYDWNNSAIVKSDIEDWKPGGGIQRDINNSRWMNIKHNYPPVSFKVDENDAQYKWILFWFQTIPGINNGIKYGQNTIANWWDRLYNWDEASRKKLYD